jgi:hypothetical protein
MLGVSLARLAFYYYGVLNINVKPSHDLHVSDYYLCTTPHSIVAVHLPIRVRNTIETLFSIQRLQTLILTEIQ